jgi:site-specific DNA-cytosine methylase
MRRIFGYPDNFIFNTSYKNAIGRLGNSVPPPLARVVATTMMNVLAHNNLVDTTTTTND